MITDDAWQGLYRLFAAIGLETPTIPVECGNQQLPIGWPRLKLAVTLDQTAKHSKFKDDGWEVVELAPTTVGPAQSLLAFVDLLARKAVVAESQQTAAMTVSKTEGRLLEALLAAGLPMPDRDAEFRDDDGNLVTVPDFTWAEARLCVFLDGLHFHGGQDVDATLKAAMENDPAVAEEIRAGIKHSATRDAAKRRKVSAAGWAVVVVTDQEVDAGWATNANGKARWDLGSVVDDIIDSYRLGISQNAPKTRSEPSGV